MKKEISIERRYSEEERNIKKNREELDFKEIEILAELCQSVIHIQKFAKPKIVQKTEFYVKIQ